MFIDFIYNAYISSIGCGGVIRYLPATITYPPDYMRNYSNNENCTWYISRRYYEGYYRIKFTHMDTERNYDFVEVWNDNGYHIKVSGQRIPREYPYLRGSTRLRFTSDDSNPGFSGFSVRIGMLLHYTNAKSSFIEMHSSCILIYKCYRI